METIPGPAGPEHPHFYILIEMFPDICPHYLRKLCLGRDDSNEALDEITLNLLDNNYKRVKTELSKYEMQEAEKKHKMLTSLFPDADPDYLMNKIKKLIRNPNDLNQFVNETMEERKYPSKTQYLKNLDLLDQENKYVIKFNLKHFLETIPNPKEYYENKNRNVSYEDKDDYFYAIKFLHEQYSFLHIKEIIEIFDKQKCSLINTVKVLETKKSKDIEKEDESKMKNNCKNIELLQEIAYVKNKTYILDFIEIQKERKARAIKIAKDAGLVYTCECCYGENFTDYDLIGCPVGHTFCKECVKKSCEVIIGDGKIDFPCLLDCGRQFKLQTIKEVVSPKFFAIISQKKQLEEVKQAEIDDLVYCPFCDYVTILAPSDKILQCLNEDCLKESCRLCKDVSHVPLRCEEVEQKETNMRTYIEEKMTEALLRKCPKCGKKFLKESGCNKMTCSCGALMCYVCKQSINGYNHFAEHGGSKCPLYSDTNLLHTQAVRTGAQRAKQDLGNVKLKFDPSQNI